MIAVVDRIVQYANRYKLTDVSTGTVLGIFDFEAETGTVQQVGTEINKELFDSIASDIAAKLTANGGDSKNCIVVFNEASTLANINTGESHSTIFGKIKKWFTDRISGLKAFAYNANTKIAKTDLDNSVQTSLGKADTALQEHQDISGKVDKVAGKGLSTEDYTTTEKSKLAGIASGAEVNVQSDWSQSDNTKDDYIKNKPTKLTDFNNDGNFVRDANYVHTDSNYTAGEKSKLANLPTDTVRYGASQSLTDAQKAQARSNIGAGTSSFSGAYNDLTGKPTIPDELADLTSDSTHRTVTDTEKTTWNAKQDALASQTAYSAKGTTTKVPQITTNTLGQVTKIEEKSIAFPVTSVNGRTGAVTGLMEASNLSNPNLLINSNFAINQRDGYFAPVDTVVYENADGTNPIGIVATAIQTATVSGTIRSATNVSVKGVSTYKYRETFASAPKLKLTYNIYGNGLTTPDLYGVSGTAETKIGASSYTYDRVYNRITISDSGVLEAYNTFAVYYALDTNAQTISGTLYFKTSDCTSGYTGGRYSVDRFYLVGNSATLTPTANGITIVSGGSWQGINQEIEDYSKLKGQTLVLSIKIAITNGSGTFVMGIRDNSGAVLELFKTATTTKSIFTAQTTIPNDWSGTRLYVYVWSRYASQTIEIEWVKLEVGSIATEYILPNPAEELIKCLRYFFRLQSTDTIFIAEGHAGSATTAYFPFNLPMPMRVTPTVTLSDIGDFNLYSVSGSAITITNLYASRFDKWNTRCTLNITSSGMTSQGSYILRAKFPKSYIDIDAELY